MMSVEKRFWSKVDVRSDSECWPWKGCVNRRKVCIYGRFRITTDRTEFAHRAAYLLQHGEIPEGAHVCHTCGNSLCCNPAHLYAGDASTNAADTTAHGTRKGGANPGEEHHRSKLTNAQRVEIGRRNRSGESASPLAREYSVSDTQIRRIAKEGW